MLKAVVTDLNAVDEGDRKYYVQKDGKFFLNVTPVDGFVLENVDGLKGALGAERNTVSQLRDQLKPFEKIDPAAARTALDAIAAYGDITPEKAKTAIETAQRLSAIDPAKEADRLAGEKVTTALNTHKAQWTLQETELKGSITNLQAQNESLTGQLQSLLKGNQIKDELAKHNPLDDARDAIELLAGNAVRTSVKDGKVVVEVVDAAGNPRIKDAQGTPFTVGDLVAEIKEQRPGLFKAENKNGMGFNPANGTNPANTGQVNPWSKETWNVTQQMLLTRNKPDLAKQLKAQAGK
jgi:hypothetical protein